MRREPRNDALRLQSTDPHSRKPASDPIRILMNNAG